MRTEKEKNRGKEYLGKLFDITNEANLPISHIIAVHIIFISFLVDNHCEENKKSGMLLSIFQGLMKFTKSAKTEHETDNIVKELILE